jgi:hypothetical protein
MKYQNWQKSIESLFFKQPAGKEQAFLRLNGTQPASRHLAKKRLDNKKGG